MWTAWVPCVCRRSKNSKGKQLAEVEDQIESGTNYFAAADDSWIVIASTTGRVWPVHYATGQVSEDIGTSKGSGVG